jgi:type VI secretion system secreted protein VgrG
MIALRSVSHSSHNPANVSEGEFFYNQSFTAVPSTEPFHPPRVTPKACVRGPQTAVVVDQEDPEGYGRIKVRFHWNLEDDPTCWLRVAQQWAGDQIGALWTPRVGWEVLVVFLEGDPDRPVIAGGLYNADNMPPFSLPSKLSQSGWRTRTWPTGQVVNELIFEDVAGGEEVYLYAGRNYRREIVDDETATIGGYRTTKVGKDQSLDVAGKSTTDIKKSDTLTVGDDQTIKIGGNSKTTIDKDETVDVTGDSTTTITGDNTFEVKGKSDTTVKKDAEVKISGDMKITVKGDITVDGSGDTKITSKGEVSVEAMTMLTLKVGGSQIEISPLGVTISGDLVTITGALVQIN